VSLPPFQTLLDSHAEELRRFLWALAGPQAADDCLQETWLSALRAYPRLRSDSNLRAWLFTIARRKAVDHARARRRAPLAAGDGAEVGDALMATPAAEPADAELWARVRALPDKQRTAVALRYVVDAEYAEIAAAMGTSQDAARRSVHEGLKRLREELDDE
jgi:RNA polymerase sigma factor (sigma-70 family)